MVQRANHLPSAAGFSVLQRAPDPTRTVASAAMQRAFDTTRTRVSGAQPPTAIQRQLTPEMRNLADIEDFLYNQVAPWATQARIRALMHESATPAHIGNVTDPSPAVFKPPSASAKSDLQWSGFAFLPSQVSTEGPKSNAPGIHRDVPEFETYDGSAFVRVYHTGTLKKSVEPPKKPKINQNPEDGRIGIDQKKEGKTFFLSGGTPLRQLNWAEKKPRESPGSRAVVQSFLVPLTVYNSITATAVPEQQGGQAEVRNVDPTGAPNQYGFSGNAFHRMRNAIIPGSLITYVEDPSALEGSGWGEVRRIEELRQRLHVPSGVGLVGRTGRENIIVDEKSAKFAQKVFFTSNEPGGSDSARGKNFGATADEYADVLGLWLGGQDRNELLNLCSRHTSPSQFEAHRLNTLKAFLGRFGYKLPDNWQEIRNVARVRYAESARAFERNLGVYLATHPDANHAASQMCSGLYSLYLDQKRTDIHRFGRDDTGSAGAIGLDKFQLSLVPAQGNLRERLTWVLAAIRNGIAGEILIAANLRKKAIPQFHDPKKERDKSDRLHVAEEKQRITMQKPLEVQHPPLSSNEWKFAVRDGALQWEPGGLSIEYKMKTAYQQQADRELRLVASGPSGSTFAMLYVAHHLGVNLQHARLALLTWMLTVGDHTFDEIMEGVAIWAQKKGIAGLEYNRSTPKRYRYIAPLTEYELRRRVCEDEEFPDEHITEGMIQQAANGGPSFFLEQANRYC